MQTRRDQLQAYRFQNRRALAALVTGEPNVLEAPMRRLTVTTISGIMIAVLIASVFAIIAFFRPDSGDKWKAAGSIIVVRDTAAIFILTKDGTLHPVVNYASAVLAVGQSADAHRVDVDESDLGSTPRGYEIGINGLPTTFPSPGDLVKPPWTVCSRQVQGDANNLQAKVTVYAGTSAPATTPTGDKAVLAKAVGASTSYLLVGGTRYPVDASGAVAAYLNLQTATAVTVGSAFLNAVPAGPALAPPKVDGAGDPISAYGIGGKPLRVGQVLDVDGGSAQLVALADGVATLTPVQAALLSAVTANGQPLPVLSISRGDESTIITHQSGAPWTKLDAEFGDIPQTLPGFATQPATNGGICAGYAKAATRPTLSVPRSLLPAYPASAITQSEAAGRGVADDVVIEPGGAALVQFTGQKSTVFLVAGPGRKYPAASRAALKGFGYSGVTPTQLPVQLEPLIPNGPAFDPVAALKPPAQ